MVTTESNDRKSIGNQYMLQNMLGQKTSKMFKIFRIICNILILNIYW